MAFPIPANLWTHWNLDPVFLLLAALAVALYMGVEQRDANYTPERGPDDGPTHCAPEQ